LLKSPMPCWIRDWSNLDLSTQTKDLSALLTKVNKAELILLSHILRNYELQYKYHTEKGCIEARKISKLLI